jgi:hypothetical protein
MVRSLIRRAGKVFGNAGVSRSTARAIGATELIERLEQRQLLTADLALEISDLQSLPSFLVPGDRPVLNFLIRNNSPEAFTGRVNILVQMFAQDPLTGLPEAEATYAFNLPTPVQLTNLAPDASAAVNVTNFDMPASFQADGSISGVTPGDYFIFGTITRPEGQTWTDEFVGNNQVDVTFDQPMSVVWGFGAIGDRTNVVFTATDADDVPGSTRFSMSMAGGGAGLFSVPNNALGQVAPVPVQLTIDLPDTSAASVWTVTSLAPTSATGAARSVDLTMNFESSRAVGSYTVNAAPLNLTGSGDFEIIPGAPLTATLGNVTGSIDVQSIGLFSSTASVRSLTLGNLSGSLGVGGSVLLGGDVGAGRIDVGTLRVGNVTPLGLDPTSILIDGNVTSAVFGNIARTGLEIRGNATALTVGNVESAGIYVGGNGTSFRAGDLSSLEFNYGGRLGTFVASDIELSEISLNSFNRPYRYGTSFAAQFVTDTSLFVSGLLSSVSVNSWVFGGLGASVGLNSENSIFAYAIGTLTTRNTGSGKSFAPGDFDATVVAGGQIARPTQIGTVNIAGELGGFIVANGSIGSITAASIDTFGTVEARVAPSILANGRLGSLTSPNLVDAQVFASNIGTLTATLRSNAVAQILAGVRFDFDDLIEDPVAFDLGDDLSYGSGSIASLALTVAPAATGIDVRASAGITAPQVGVFTGATTTRLNNTVSRLNALTINGTLTGNTFRMGFINFPASVRLAGATVAVPATGAITSPGDTLIRLSRPV